MKNRGTIISNNPLFDDKTKEYIFDAQETIYALSGILVNTFYIIFKTLDWTIFDKNKSYHYIVVGTSINSFSGVSKGNLHILVISYKSEKVDVKRINKILLDYPIYSISLIGK